jgi:hypothetical protein
MNSYSIISAAGSPNRAEQKFGVRGHVRALKAATCRRATKGASSDFIIPSPFVIRASSF